MNIYWYLGLFNTIYRQNDPVCSASCGKAENSQELEKLVGNISQWSYQKKSMCKNRAERVSFLDLPDAVAVLTNKYKVQALSLSCHCCKLQAVYVLLLDGGWLWRHRQLVQREQGTLHLSSDQQPLSVCSGSLVMGV